MPFSFKDTFTKAARLILLCALSLITGYTYTYTANYVYNVRHSKEYIDTRIQEIYKNIIVASGMSTKALPLRIEETDDYNAYTNGKEIVIYRGLINKSNWDTIAYVIGHEYSHVLLEHLRLKPEDGVNPETYSQEHEALADKMGAWLMLRAGYNICAAREGWKDLQAEVGDSIGGTHPDLAYRYDELDLNCHWWNS